MKSSVLVVDDDPSVVRMLEMGLADEYRVVPIDQPWKALAVLAAEDIDVIVTDIRMPEISGFEILRAAKESNQLVEVILLTGKLPDKAKPAVAALHSGAHDYLLKPVRIRELKKAICQALSKQRQHMEDKRKLQQLIRRANTDYLTGLSNRHHFQHQLKLEFDRSDRYERSLSCIILDIDDFKRINDDYGHYAGDLVLQRLGELILAHFRSSDLKCRYGGEEFVLVLPEANEERAAMVAEKLRRLIAKQSFDFAQPPLQITTSIGIATSWKRNFASAENLIHAADVALLQAKRAGRNCVRAHSDDPYQPLPPPATAAVNARLLTPSNVNVEDSTGLLWSEG
jgi:two-component system cell cycle response regulator